MRNSPFIHSSYKWGEPFAFHLLIGDIITCFHSYGMYTLRNLTTKEEDISIQFSYHAITLKNVYFNTTS